MSYVSAFFSAKKVKSLALAHVIKRFFLKFSGKEVIHSFKNPCSPTPKVNKHNHWVIVLEKGPNDQMILYFSDEELLQEEDPVLANDFWKEWEVRGLCAAP